MKSETCLHDLREHSGDIYTLQWSPTGPGSGNPSANPMLATSVGPIPLTIVDPFSLFYTPTSRSQSCSHLSSFPYLAPNFRLPPSLARHLTQRCVCGRWKRGRVCTPYTNTGIQSTPSPSLLTGNSLPVLLSICGSTSGPLRSVMGM